MEQSIINSAKSLVGNLVSLSKKGKSTLWVDYDKEADVLYVSFGHPQKADHSYQEEGIIRRVKKHKLIGLTILNASHLAK